MFRRNQSLEFHDDKGTVLIFDKRSWSTFRSIAEEYGLDAKTEVAKLIANISKNRQRE